MVLAIREVQTRNPFPSWLSGGGCAHKISPGTNSKLCPNGFNSPLSHFKTAEPDFPLSDATGSYTKQGLDGTYVIM